MTALARRRSPEGSDGKAEKKHRRRFHRFPAAHPSASHLSRETHRRSIPARTKRSYTPREMIPGTHAPAESPRRGTPIRHQF